MTFTRDQTDRLARRLAIALVGEVDRREELLRTAGVTNLDDYRQALTMRTDIELCHPAGADDNDAFGLDYAELSAVQARQLLRRASCTSASAAIALEPAY